MEPKPAEPKRETRHQRVVVRDYCLPLRASPCQRGRPQLFARSLSAAAAGLNEPQARLLSGPTMLQAQPLCHGPCPRAMCSLPLLWRVPWRLDGDPHARS